jgi:response regulator RpfG family c-di-GMP phosphodiesterase
MNNRILWVDDDPNVLAGFERTLRRRFLLQPANDGAEALQCLQESGPFAVVVADMRMPGMNGLELLAKVQAQAPDTVRIMLTGNADQPTAIGAVNQGHVFRFLTKPCDAETLLLALNAGLSQYALVTGERELLEKTLSGAVRVLTDILATVDSRSFNRAHVLRDQMRHFLVALSGKVSWECELAALLSLIGCVTVPAPVLQRARLQEDLSTSEQEMLDWVPEAGSRLIARIPRLENVAKIIRYQKKNFDGSGFPADHLAGQDLPVGARILKVLADLLDLQGHGLTRVAALAVMRGRRGLYDPRVLEVAGQALETAPAKPTAIAPATRQVGLDELAPDQLLLADVETKEGLSILSAGTRLTPTMLDLIRNFAKLNGIREPLLIREAPE